MNLILEVAVLREAFFLRHFLEGVFVFGNVPPLEFLEELHSSIELEEFDVVFLHSVEFGRGGVAGQPPVRVYVDAFLWPFVEGEFAAEDPDLN